MSLSHRVAAGAAISVMALAIVVLMGWLTHTPVLVQVRPDLAPMQRNAAVCFFLLGVAMLGASAARRRRVIMFAAGGIGVAALTLLQYLLDRDLGVDQILGPAYIVVKTSSPGRMEPATATCFIVAGTGLLLNARALSARTGWLLAMSGSIVAAVGVANWMGFAIGSADTFAWGALTRLGLLTTLAFLVLGSGMVALAWNAGARMSGTPAWLPVSLFLVVATAGVGFWQALSTTERSGTALPGFVLGTGILRAAIVALAVFLAQRAHAAAVALKEANRKLEEQASQLRASERRLAVQFAVTRVLAESGSLAKAMPDILRALCENIGWQSGELWRVSPDGQILALAARWPEPITTGAASGLATGVTTCPLGAGLPGYVVQTGTAYWVSDVRDDSTFQRTAVAAVDGDIWSAFAVPVRASGDTIGAIAFFSANRRETDEVMLQMLTVIGSQIGQFVERKRLEDEVDSFFDLSRDLLSIATFDGRFTRVNPSWHRTLGHSADDLLAASSIDLVHPDDRERTIAARQAVVAGGDLFGFENRYRARSGEYRWMQWTSTASPDRQLVYAVARDVTDRRQADAVLHETQREQMRLTDGFLSHVSHELRSPLTAVNGLIAVLAHDLAPRLNAEQKEYVRIILSNLSQLKAMINDLLEVARAETGKLSIELQSMSIHDAVADALETLRLSAMAKDIALSSDVPDTMPQAYADPRRMQQILTNLINNAVKFTPPHGAVQVHAHVRDRDPTRLVVEVSDTGCGIRPADTDRIFERLYQVGEAGQGHRTGLGLGLEICKQLVERQGGEIWVTSELLKGSTFSFTVAVAARAA